MWWMIGLIGVLLAYVSRLHLRVRLLETCVKTLNDRHWADHELLLKVTDMAVKLDAIDVLERVGSHKQADEVRGYGQHANE